jgi:hypothetical protein
MKQANIVAPSMDIRSTGFRPYLVHDTLARNIQYLLLMLCEWIVFKFLYPYPSFFSDSYSYIHAADWNLGANIWPIGYSRFLYYFHAITHSAAALTLFQYLSFELVALYFYRTILFFFSPTKFTRVTLSILLFFNPLNLYLANFVSSDGLFAALSLFWLTTLIWLIYRPTIAHLLILSAVFFTAFTFRYNAMYYPLISAPVFLISKKALWFKWLGLLLSPMLILPFILYTSNAAKEMSGTPQFPPILGGWQWANNALYMREYINDDTSRFPNAKMAELDLIAKDFYHRVPAKDRQLSSYVGNFFIIDTRAPLKQYMHRHYAGDTSYGGVGAWAKPAPLFKEYGTYLIKKHPIPFLQHYILLNTKNYFIPPLEKLKVYNLGTFYIAPIAMQWFDFPGQTADVISLTFQGYLLGFYPVFFLILNALFAWTLIAFFRQKGFQITGKEFAYLIGIVSALVIINAAFSIFANIVVFRYQIFPFYTLVLIVLLLTDFIFKARRQHHGPFTTLPQTK